MQENFDETNKKGAISLFVLLSILFFIAIVTAVALNIKNANNDIDMQEQRIKSMYEKDVGNEEYIYNEKKTEEEN